MMLVLCWQLLAKPALAAPRDDAGSTELSLSDAIRNALAAANDYAIAKDDEQVAAGEAKSAAMRLLPALGANASVVYNSPSPAGGQSFLSENSVLWYRATGGISGSLLGGTGAQIKADRALLAAAHAGTEIARRNLIQATVEAYYGVSLADAQLGAAEATQTVAQKLADVTALRFNAGEVPEADVLRTKLLAVAAGDAVLQARAASAAADANLGVFAGTDHAWHVDPLVADASPGDDATSGPAPISEQADGAVDAAKAQVAVTRAQSLPTVDYYAGYGLDSDTLGAGLSQHLGAIVGATVTVPIFDWGIGARAVTAAKLAVDKAELSRQQTLRQNAADIATARAAADTARDRARTLSDSLGDAQRSADIALARYNAGEADLVEWSDAQQTLADTRVAANQAAADYQIALWRVHLQAGK